ncbi:hypothetical protein GCM10010256_38200 [Streptomyces coeruleorubidus]|nr:hypothetical protein GCM10010256_38200 [Streptomyces coeruleorubidus]
MARQQSNKRVAAGRTLIRRYVVALTPAGVSNEASVMGNRGYRR